MWWEKYNNISNAIPQVVSGEGNMHADFTPILTFDRPSIQGQIYQNNSAKEITKVKKPWQNTKDGMTKNSAKERTITTT